MDSKHVTEEIKQRLPIEQVIGGYLPLKKAGRIYKSVCPFHHEKTPSFTVSPDRGIFKCFGCNEGGDIFDFVMKIEGLTFPETVRLLGERAGVEMEEYRPDPKHETGIPKDRLYRLNSYAARLWHTILTQHPKSQLAREYLAGRGLLPETITNFQIGYAPPGPTTAQALQKAGFSRAEIQAAGDPTKFQDRIIFPIQDITGRVIGFTGRLLELKDDPRGEASRGPKYWNTPETALFNKGRTVYALHAAKQAIVQQNKTILAEGQMDVIMLHQAGYINTVASSGTALTLDQLHLLGRFSPNLVFAYDGDKAGKTATERGIELALEAELNPSVVEIPNGKDPAECLQKQPEAWEQAYAAAQPFMQWLITQTLGSEPKTLTPVAKKEAAARLVPWLARVHDRLEQEDWIRLTAAHLHTEEANITAALGRLKTPAPRRSQSEASEPPATPTPEAPSLLKAAELAAVFILSHPDILAAVTNPSDLLLAGETPFLKQAFTQIEHLAKTKELPPQNREDKSFLLHSEELLRPYQEIEMTSRDILGEVLLILQRLRQEAKEETKERLAQEIRSAQLLGDQAKLQQLFSELKNLI